MLREGNLGFESRQYSWDLLFFSKTLDSPLLSKASVAQRAVFSKVWQDTCYPASLTQIDLHIWLLPHCCHLHPASWLIPFPGLQITV